MTETEIRHLESEAATRSEVSGFWPPASARMPTALVMPIGIRVLRSGGRRRCSACHRRRIVYWLEATSGWHGSSPQLCSICSGLLVHGGRHTDEETP